MAAYRSAKRLFLRSFEVLFQEEYSQESTVAFARVNKSKDRDFVFEEK